MMLGATAYPCDAAVLLQTVGVLIAADKTYAKAPLNGLLQACITTLVSLGYPCFAGDFYSGGGFCHD
jgi:hypothetical protein